MKPQTVSDASDQFMRRMVENSRTYASSPAALAAAHAESEELQRLQIQNIRRQSDAPDGSESHMLRLRAALGAVTRRFEPLLKAAASREAHQRLEQEMHDAIMKVRIDWRGTFNQL